MGLDEFEFDAFRIKRIRVALGLNEAAFAELIGTTSNSVSNWERGRNKPTRAGLLKALLEFEKKAGLARPVTPPC